MRPIIAVSAFVLALGAAEADATVLYKLTDPLGHITYSDSVPRGFAGAVARIEVDSGAHTIAPTRIPDVLTAPPTRNALAAPPRVATSAEERLRFARAGVDAARLALEDAQLNSTPDDWYWFGPNNPVGMRRAPRPEYAEKLVRLEGDLLAAQDSLRNLERELR